jgi:hypothetical protein
MSNIQQIVLTQQRPVAAQPRFGTDYRRMLIADDSTDWHLEDRKMTAARRPNPGFPGSSAWSG